MVKARYESGKANTCLFYSLAEDCSVTVHGDDFAAVGNQKDMDKFRKSLETACKVKCAILGGGKDEFDEIRVVIWVIRRDDSGFKLEAGPRHAEIVIRDLGLEGARSSKLPGFKEEHKRTGGGLAGPPQHDGRRPLQYELRFAGSIEQSLE